MREERAGRLLLDRCQLAVELELQRGTVVPLVLDRQLHAVLGEKLLGFGHATPRQSHEQRPLLGAGDHPRSQRGRQAHLLLLVELGVLEGGEPLQQVQ